MGEVDGKITARHGKGLGAILGRGATLDSTPQHAKETLRRHGKVTVRKIVAVNAQRITGAVLQRERLKFAPPLPHRLRLNIQNTGQQAGQAKAGGRSEVWSKPQQETAHSPIRRFSPVNRAVNHDVNREGEG